MRKPPAEKGRIQAVLASRDWTESRERAARAPSTPTLAVHSWALPASHLNNRTNYKFFKELNFRDNWIGFNPKKDNKETFQRKKEMMFRTAQSEKGYNILKSLKCWYLFCSHDLRLRMLHCGRLDKVYYQTCFVGHPVNIFFWTLSIPGESAPKKDCEVSDLVWDLMDQDRKGCDHSELNRGQETKEWLCSICYNEIYEKQIYNSMFIIWHS